MSDEDREELIGYLSRNPMAGVVVPGAGGVRKLRWALEGRGKSGGARIIYYFHNMDVPLFALTAFAKNDRSNLTQQERNDFRRLVKVLVEPYRR